MTKLLSELELRRRVIEHVSGIQTGVVSHSETTDSLLDLIQEQKIAHADMVIGEDVPHFDDKCTSDEGCFCYAGGLHILQNEQRQRNHV